MNNGHEKLPGKSQEKVKKIIEDVAAKSKAFLSHSKEVISEQAESLKSKADEYGVSEMPDNVRTYVRRHPLQSIGIAIGFGFFIGYLLKSSKRSDS